MSSQTQQRPFGFTNPHLGSTCPNKWAIADLDEWLAATVVQPDRFCQVYWRERPQWRDQYQNFATPAEAAGFAGSLIANLGTNLFDLCISPNEVARTPLSKTTQGRKS